MDSGPGYPDQTPDRSRHIPDRSGIRLLFSDLCQVGFPIRRSRGQSLFPARPRLSQGITSFIASCCQGIHQTPFSRLIRPGRSRPLPAGSSTFPGPRARRAGVVSVSVLDLEQRRRARAPEPLTGAGRASTRSRPGASATPMVRSSRCQSRSSSVEPDGPAPPAGAGRSGPQAAAPLAPAGTATAAGSTPVLRARPPWSLSGSNRRPPACKAGALPAELRPRPRRAAGTFLPPALRLVGRGGVEPPTSRLSGVRSNHLSYRPTRPVAGTGRQSPPGGGRRRQSVR